MNEFSDDDLTHLIVMVIHIKNDYPGMSEEAAKMVVKLVNARNKLREKRHKKPTVGLFGNEVQNQIHKEMMDGIYNRLERIEKFLNLRNDE